MHERTNIRKDNEVKKSLYYALEMILRRVICTSTHRSTIPTVFCKIVTI